MKRIKTTLAVLALATISGGCSNTRVHPITDQEFQPARNVEQVKMYLGVVDRPHVQLAFVNSFPDSDKTVAIKRDQLRDLQKRAADLGADAVMDVRLLTEKHRGMTVDPTVPFRAWKQGDFDLYFLRGVAIRFVDESDPEWEEQQAGLPATDTEQMAESILPEQSLEEIPEQHTNEEPARDVKPRTGY